MTYQKKILVTGANGQLGTALRTLFPEAEFVSRQELDIADPSLSSARDWSTYKTIINAAAYTAVDAAETAEGRRNAWKANAHAAANLSKIATQNDLTLVHVSSEYVFDGTVETHTEAELFSPLGVYGQTKAAGDLAASTTPRHYIIRTTWVIGEGKNFVLTMKSLAERDIKPSVVGDQIGRLTFTEDLGEGIKHLIETNAPFGTYNLSNDGEQASWADIATIIYTTLGKSADNVTSVTTQEYFKDKPEAAPRPLQSTLDLAKIKSTGFMPKDWRVRLNEYLTLHAQE